MTLQQPERSQAKYAIHAFDCPVKNVHLADIPASLKDFNPRIFQRSAEVFDGTPNKIIENNDFGYFGFEQLVNYMAADKSGTAYDQNSFFCGFYFIFAFCRS